MHRRLSSLLLLLLLTRPTHAETESTDLSPDRVREVVANALAVDPSERESPELHQEPDREVHTEDLRGFLSGFIAPAAVSPPTDPDFQLESDLVLGGHLFQGDYALLHTEGGAELANMGVGLDALVSMTVGPGGLLNAVANTAVGSLAQHNTTEGDYNTALGAAALYLNTEGDDNTAIGARALSFVVDGEDNTAVGANALLRNLASDNTAVGNGAMSENETGVRNTAMGNLALVQNETGSWNTAVGDQALRRNDASWNTAVGVNALESNTTGISNTAVGYGSQRYGTTGIANTSLGVLAGAGIIDGDLNVALGWNAQASRYGQNNIAIGSNSGGTNIGDDNIFIGREANDDDEATIRIGDDDVHEAFYAAGVRGTNVGSGIQVLVGGVGRLGTVTSSRRFKEEIEPMRDASGRLLDLRPVTFRYREEAVGDGPRAIEFGLIAEEVAEIYPDLVAYDEQGEPYSVRYHVLPAMLLNELQKQHEQDRSQRREIELLRERLRLHERALQELLEEAR